MLRSTRLVAISICVALSAGTAAAAEPYPSRTIKLIVPYPAGGVVDITGRLVAEHLQKKLANTVIVENRPGAGGTTGAAAVARAEPDGYTLLIAGAATHAFAPSLFKSLPYDPVADFVPITQVTEGPLALCIPEGSEIKDLAGFVAFMKEKGPNTNYASNGYGTYPHLAMELFKQRARFESVHVSFRGGNEALTALLGGQVQFSLNHVPIVLPQVQASKFRVLATSGTTRAHALPGVPTMKEAGYDVVASAWFGLFAPAKTPREIVDRIYQGVVSAARDQTFTQRLAAQGDEVVIEGPDRFLAYQKSELAKWTAVIRAANIKPN